MQSKRPTRLSRRSFFGTLGGATTAVAVAVAVRPDEAQAYDPGDDEAGPRYQETEHVKEFYRVNRYPAAKG